MTYHERRVEGRTSSDLALEHLAGAATVGLGTGHAAAEFVEALGRKVKGGLQIRGIPTSERTARLAREVGIELASIDEVGTIDVTVDGADEVDPELNLIKGLGGALLREKIVAAASRRLIILVGPEKQVPVLGSHGRLPVEIVRFGQGIIAKRLGELGYGGAVRTSEGHPYITDNGNLIFDCVTGPILKPAEVDRRIRSIPGVVATGIFEGMASSILIQETDSVLVLERG